MRTQGKDAETPATRQRPNGQASGQDRCTMLLATVIGLLALFSILSIVLGGEDEHDLHAYRRDEFPFWLKYGHR